ncbi:MAG: DUF1127 domain-containing protein [Pseudomonadota bacterium]
MTRRPHAGPHSVLGTGFGSLIASLARAHRTTARIRHLLDLSDAELARRGLTRSEIVRRVFDGRG